MSAVLTSNLDGTDADLEKCKTCAHHEATNLFDLCKHSASIYTACGSTDHHTIGHMRTRGPCGSGAALFIKRKS
jgi:hypothetical protein